MLLLTTAIVLALFLDILLRQKLLKRPVLRVAAPGCKPERRPYTVQQGGNAMISRHSAAVLMHGEDGAYHIFDNGCDTVLCRGTVLTLSDSGEQITVRKHPAAMPFTVLVVCVLLFLRLVPLPVMRHMLIKPAYEKLTFREPDYHWVSGDSLTPDQLAREDDIYNLLLIGTDGRGTLEPRADTMLLVSCNRRTRKLSVVSLLRDLRVQGYDPNALTVQEAAQARGLTPDDPNYAILAQMLKNDGQYRYMKLNETFTLTDDNAADAEERYLSACRSLLMNIEYTFGIRIDGFAAVDFTAVVNVVDAMGGMETDIPAQAYVDDMKRVLVQQNRLFGRSDQVSGTGRQTLNGNQALAYVRMRYVDNCSDIERAARQRAFLKQMAKQLLKKVFRVDRERLTEACTHIMTDVPEADTVTFCRQVLNGFYTLDFKQSLPREGGREDLKVTGRDGTEIRYLYVPDWMTPLTEQVSEVIYQNMEEVAS